jgi:hypothetical protein
VPRGSASSVRGYHVGNVGLHILSALVLCAIVRRTLATPKLRHRFAPASGGIAIASALIWMVHPLHTGGDRLRHAADGTDGRFRQALAIDPTRVEARTRLDRIGRAGVR